MRTLLTRFDPAVIHVIGKLPRRLQRPFHILGYATMPYIWAACIGVWILISLFQDTFQFVDVLMLFAVYLATVLKLFIRRERPPTIYAENMRVRSYSFPSSHAYAAALGAGFFSLLLFESGIFIAGGALVLLAVVVGVSRVYLGAHYPTDVAAGWLLGAVVVGVYALV